MAIRKANTLASSNRGQNVLRPLRPNVGIEATYRRKLKKLVDEMHNSVNYWIKSIYKNNEPATMAQDASPAVELQRAVRRLTRRWQKRFNDFSVKMAEGFADQIYDYSDATFKAALRQAGFTVRFTMTPAMRDVLNATIAQNVNLIRSIPQQYLNEVQGAVMRSVQTGRDLSQLTKQLERHYEITGRRAALIARDQNNKATSAMLHARQDSVGITEAVWMHSHAGKKPRPSHVKMNNKKYKIKEGMWDDDEGRYVLPGELINCRCTQRPIVKGFS